MLIAAAMLAFVFGVIAGGAYQSWMGFRPGGWLAIDGKRYRTIEIQED